MSKLVWSHYLSFSKIQKTWETNKNWGVPTVAQQDQQHLCCAGHSGLKDPALEFPLWRSGNESDWLQVRSLALLSGLSIRCCCELWCRSQMWLRSGAAVGPLAWKPPYAADAALKNKQTNVKGYYEQLDANKFDNLEDMANFLERCNPPKLNRDKIDHLNRPITRNELEYQNKKTPFTELEQSKNL